MLLEFLLRAHARRGDENSLPMAVGTAEAVARGGLHDQLAGGFARYSVDAQWVVPHVEEVLHDNALRFRVYAHLARSTGLDRARDGRPVAYVCRGLVCAAPVGDVSALGAAMRAHLD